MPFVEHDHVVEQIPAAVADTSFRHTVLPGAAEAGSFRLDAEVLHRVDDFLIEVCAAIEDQVFGSRVIRECLAQLLNNPCARWMSGDIAVKNPPPVVSDDEETVENAEGERWHGEEIHRRNGFTMIAQKCHPLLSRLGIPRGFSHPVQHCSLHEIETQHFQFTMNARRAPSRVLGDHSEDEFAQFPAHALSSRSGPVSRKPLPIHFEACPMPANDSLRLDEDQSPLPSWPEPPQDHPEQSVRRPKPRLRMLPPQDCDLLPKCQVFKEEISA